MSEIWIMGEFEIIDNFVIMGDFEINGVWSMDDFESSPIIIH